ncbi:PREDICTED: uncharacterized protein LOC109227501 [Nicotiana attenuata]|uniref:Uncharacterized protein n=1 Tax=Nicotiana attenuata TaxID=49451 RepID=A0A1J6ID82_NICAT|nr:PREDICTED: uncharacterized protein LOC109227501 [Nicotiana attenuata]XP_019248239.1 PREDICTED: uncharacterized protein LOC109227501 [Nicotiana attenuata]XP_019248240.1 PREDICTED: uncharacterized protein LOC109227501 [Nicotiana attenuata]OIT02886.1 hypothetical protein A4A49_42198 [Nicotiana attenuata]
MVDVLPLCASPHPCVEPPRASRFCSIVSVSYKKCRHFLRAVVSILKMIRLPGLCTCSQPVDVVGDDWIWFLLGFIPLWCIWLVFPICVKGASDITFISYYIVSTTAYLIPWYSVMYWHREMSPFRLIGAKAIFMIEVIPMIIAAALHHLLEYNVGYFVILLGCTTCVYIFAHFMHAAYDIGDSDFLLGLAMLVLVNWLNEEMLVGVLELLPLFKFLQIHDLLCS